MRYSYAHGRVSNKAVFGYNIRIFGCKLSPYIIGFLEVGSFTRRADFVVTYSEVIIPWVFEEVLSGSFSDVLVRVRKELTEGASAFSDAFFYSGGRNRK